MEEEKVNFLNDPYEWLMIWSFPRVLGLPKDVESSGSKPLHLGDMPLVSKKIEILGIMAKFF